METEEGQKQEKIKHREEKKGGGGAVYSRWIIHRHGYWFSIWKLSCWSLYFIGIGLGFVAFAISLFYKN